MKIQPKFAILLVILSGLSPSTVAAAPSLEGNAALLYAVGQSANFEERSRSTILPQATG